jgi:hypothetical protein
MMATNVQRDISINQFSNIKPVMKSSQTVSNADYATAQSIDTIEVYLLTQGFTQAQLNVMTKNDKVYAYRIKKGASTTPLP